MGPDNNMHTVDTINGVRGLAGAASRLKTAFEEIKKLEPYASDSAFTFSYFIDWTCANKIAVGGATFDDACAFYGSGQGNGVSHPDTVIECSEEIDNFMNALMNATDGCLGGVYHAHVEIPLEFTDIEPWYGKCHLLDTSGSQNLPVPLPNSNKPLDPSDPNSYTSPQIKCLITEGPERIVFSENDPDCGQP